MFDTLMKGGQELSTTHGRIAISIIDLLIGLALSFLLGLVVVCVYRWTHRGLNYDRSFLVTLIVIPSIIAVVMMFIGSNLALSLGMVGALSIIRFRTVIKDSRDMVFLFLCIAIGLGCGTQNWIVTMIATGFISAVLLFMFAVRFGVSKQADYALVVSGSQQQIDEAIYETVKSHVDYLEIRSIDVNEQGWEIVFEVRFLKDQAIAESRLYESLKEKHKITRLSLLAPQLSLPL